MWGSRDFHQLDERAQKSPLFGGFVGCARLFQQPANGHVYRSQLHTDAVRCFLFRQEPIQTSCSFRALMAEVC